MLSIIFFCIFLLIPNITAAQTPSNEDVLQIQNYLNGIRSLQANFIQTASNGSAATGKMYMQKPNMIRMEYNPPYSVLIVGDGKNIVYNDKDIDQVTEIDYDDVPATLILTGDIVIDGKRVKVLDYYKDAGTTVVTLEHKIKGDIGPITLVFENSPFELKQWKVTDPQGIEITVSLYDVHLDINIDKKMFSFK